MLMYAHSILDDSEGVAVTEFFATDLLDALEEMDPTDFDSLPFGLIAMDRSGDVIWYNAFESERAGLSAERVVGRNFFKSVGPCTDNYLIAQRYVDAQELDEQVDFVFTLRMLPTPVRLRLLARAGSDRQYLVVLNR
jgi:photoactive yellow protein